MFRRIAAAVVGLAAAFAVHQAALAVGLEQAVARSRTTGLPLLVVGTSDT